MTSWVLTQLSCAGIQIDEFAASAASRFPAYSDSEGGSYTHTLLVWALLLCYFVLDRNLYSNTVARSYSAKGGGAATLYSGNFSQHGPQHPIFLLIRHLLKPDFRMIDGWLTFQRQSGRWSQRLQMTSQSRRHHRYLEEKLVNKLHPHFNNKILFQLDMSILK